MEEHPSFMTCILRIDINADRWQRTIAKVLKNVNVTNFRMNTDGTVEISGSVYPNKFLKILKKARKKTELCHFQFGECSTNLFLPPRPIDYGIINRYGGPNNMLLSSFVGQKEDQPGYYGGRDGRFLHYGDKPSQLKKSKRFSKEKSHHNHDHNHNHNHLHGSDHNHVHGRDHNHNHNHLHGPDHNHVHGRDHNHNHIHDHDHVQGHDHGHGHDKEKNYRNHHERKLEHAAGYINATTPRTKVQLDCKKGRAEPLKSQGVNSCCLM